MSAYSEPISPFHVSAVYLKSPPERKPSRQNGGNDGGVATGAHMFGNGGFNWLHLAALPLFAALYWLVQRNPAFSAISIFVLLACLMLRLDPARRRLALAPLTFAAILLAGRLGQFVAKAAPLVGRAGVPVDIGLTWLPLFFAVTILYMPQRPSYSGNLLTAGSVLLLASGLLPGEGFAAIFNATQYFLFIALVIVLAVDFLHSAEPSQPLHT